LAGSLETIVVAWLSALVNVIVAVEPLTTRE
jgi:hypothetical protein